MKNIVKGITVVACVLVTLLANAQNTPKTVLIVFAEDSHIRIPFSFLKNKEVGETDTAPIKYLTLKYGFYNTLAERLANNGYRPMGGVSGNLNQARLYTTDKWFFTDSAAIKSERKGSYEATLVNNDNRNYYSMYLNADSASYILMINKIEVHTNIFRNLFTVANYCLDVHFDVYDRDMKRLCGRYLRKKVRMSRGTYWSSFTKQFNTLPDELALYFVNMKK